MVFHPHGRFYRGWVDLIVLVMLCAALASFLLRPLVEWWQRKPYEDARKRVRKRIEPVLQAYTSKILQYYVDHKQLPSIAELQQMQREAIERTPEVWGIIPQPRMQIREAHMKKLLLAVLAFLALLGILLVVLFLTGRISIAY